jgi:hypothetical protein
MGEGAYRENEDSEIVKSEMCKRHVANKKLSYCLISLPSFVTEMRIACSEIYAQLIALLIVIRLQEAQGQSIRVRMSLS